MPRAIPRLSLALIIAATALWLAVNRDQLDASGLQVSIRELGLLAPVAHVGLFAVGTVLFAPGALFGLVGGALFGPLWGMLVNLLGATLGASAAFLLGRYVAGDRIRRMAGGRLDRLVTGVEAEGWRFVAFVRLVPIFPFNLLNYALGLTRIPFAPYVLASLKAPDGAEKIRDMMRDDIHDALSRGDKEHASELLMVLRHFLDTHPEAQQAPREASRDVS